MKQAVCAYVKREDNKVLMVSRKDDHEDFGMPGGKAEENETLEEAVIRETFEETGYRIKVIKKIYEAEDADGYYVTTFLCELISEEAIKPSEIETGVVKWAFAPDMMRHCCTYSQYNIAAYLSLTPPITEFVKKY